MPDLWIEVLALVVGYQNSFMVTLWAFIPNHKRC